MASEHTIRMVLFKKKITQGARTLLLHGMHMWPQMINEMFRPFSIKYVSERHNSLQIDTLGK